MGDTISLNLSATALSPVHNPIFVQAVLEREGHVLRREWAQHPLFVSPGKAGGQQDARRHDDLQSRRSGIGDWRLRLPFAITPGLLTLRFELFGATAVGLAPTAIIRVVGSPLRHDFPATRIDVRGCRARLLINGVETDPTQALFISPDPLHMQNAKEAGIPIWSVALDDFGFKESGFDFTEVDQTLERYLEAKPDAWLLPTFTFDTSYHGWWIAAHPEARCRLEDGSDVIGDYAGGRRQAPSYGSEVWRKDFGNALRQLVRHLKNSPFAARILGFQPCSGVTWEWFHWGSQSGELVDYSEGGVADFRRWLRERYASDLELQQAWRKPQVTLNTAAVPTNTRRRKPEHGIFYDPATQQDLIDYHRYQHEIVADSILYFARIIKEETGGKSLAGTYYGYTMHLPESPGFCQSSGHFALERLFRSPDLDFFIAPGAYAWREIGGTGACMTPAASIALNGKLFWTQADLRTHWSGQDSFGRPQDVLGSIQAMRREFALNLAQGTAIQWYDFSNGWTFGDERLTDEAGRLLKLSEGRRFARDFPRSSYLAVIVDEEQMGTFDPFRPPYGLQLIFNQRERLHRSGVPWRAYLFSDLMRHPELLEHRAFLFLNLFRLSADQRRFLKKRVMTGGQTVAFIGPVGLMDETGFSAANSSDLLGWPMKELGISANLRAKWKEGLPEPWAECAGLEMGVESEFTPLLAPAVSGGGVLGTFSGGDQPAILFEARENSIIFWSAAPGLPPEAIRSLAATAGLPILARNNDAVYVGFNTIGIHPREDGVRRIQLPFPSAVRELMTGKSWPPGTRQVRLDLKAGETAILKCSRK